MSSLVFQCSFKKISNLSKLLYKQTPSSINRICKFKRNAVKHKKLCNIFTIYKQRKIVKPQLILTQNQPIHIFSVFSNLLGMYRISWVMAKCTKTGHGVLLFSRVDIEYLRWNSKNILKNPT